MQCLTAIRVGEDQRPSVCLSPTEFNKRVIFMITYILAVDMAWQSFSFDRTIPLIIPETSFWIQKDNQRLSMFAPKMQERSFRGPFALLPSPCQCQNVKTTSSNLVSETVPGDADDDRHET
jgi:hypothetical protein